MPRKKQIEKGLREMLQTSKGSVVFFSGPIGTGKTFELTNWAYYLVKKLDREVITNIQFENNGGKLDFPEGVHFVTSMQELWKETGNIRRKDERKVIVPIIDEFHKTVDRYRTLDQTVLDINKWLSEVRKFRMTPIFCTQFVSMLPRRLLKWTRHFVIKKPEWTKKIIGNEDRAKKKRSYDIPVRNREVAQYDYKGEIKTRDVTEFDESSVPLSAVKRVFSSDFTPWTSTRKGSYTYRTEGSARFRIKDLNDDEEWLEKLMDKISKVSNKEIGKEIESFFDEHREGGEEREDYKLDLGDDPTRAWLDWKMSSKTQQDAAREHDTTPKTVQRRESMIKDLLSEADRARESDDRQGGISL